MALSEEQKQKLQETTSKVAEEGKKIASIAKQEGVPLAKDAARVTKMTVKDLRDPSKKNKTVLKRAISILKDDVVGFVKNSYDLYRQSEDLTAYADCKRDPLCSDAIEQNGVFIPPIYDDVLLKDKQDPTPGAATVSAITDTVKAAADIYATADKAQAYANRNVEYVGDPAYFDPNGAKPPIVTGHYNSLKKEKEVVEEIVKDN